MKPTLKKLSKDEEKQLKALEERKGAYEQKTEDLREERRGKVKTVDDLLGYVDDAVKEHTRATGDALADIRDSISTLVDKVNGTVDDVNALADDEQRHLGGGIGYDHAAAGEHEKRTGSNKVKFNLGRAILGHLNNWAGPYKAFPEREMLEAFASKALEMGVSTAGGLLVPPQWMAEVIELLRPNLVAAALGARFRPLQGPTYMRKVQGGATSFWVGEGKKATKSQGSFGRIQLTPKPLVTVVPVSEDLLAMGPDGLQGDLEEDMAVSQAETLDESILKGGGGEGEPLGMVNVAGGTTDWSTADYGPTNGETISSLLDAMIYPIGGRDVRGQVSLAMSPLGVQKLRTTTDKNSMRTFTDPRSATTQTQGGGVETGTINGINYATSSALTFGTASDDMIAAVWREVMIASFGLTEIKAGGEASDGTDSAFMQRELWIRMTSRWDTMLRHDEAVQVATGWDNS